jgi:hypothetical protein
MKPIPVGVPSELLEDRSVRNLITQWRNLHLRHRECRKRIAWRNRKASELEKKRRREKWEIVARVLEIEHTLLRWSAKATKHPDIYSPKRGTARSRLLRLRRRYDENRRLAHILVGPHAKQRQQFRQKRMAIVAEMRAIIRSWMVAIFNGVYPTAHVPKALTLHPAELVPRKLKHAQRTIKQEIAA